MAGSNQAVNLGGMLNQIAGTIGSGYTINGKNAGAAIGDTFANLAKPELDPNNPESLKEMADWASRNGRTQEAAQYSAEYMRQAKEQAALNAAKANSGLVQAGNKASQTADYRGLNNNIDKLRGAQANAQTAAQYDAIGKQIAQLEAKLEPTRQAHVQNQAKQVEGLEQWLESNADNAQIPDHVKEQAAAQREAMLNNADVSKAYRSNQIADAQATMQTNAAKESQRQEFVNANYDKAKQAGGGAWEQFQQQANAMGAGHLVQSKEESALRLEGVKANLEQTNRAIIEQDVKLADTNSARGLKDIAGKVDMSEAQEATYNQLMVEVREMDEAKPGEENLPRAERMKLARRISALETELTNTYNVKVEQAASVRKQARESVTRLQENRAKLAQTIPQARVTEVAVRKWAEKNKIEIGEVGTSRFGDNSQDMKDIESQALAEFGDVARQEIVAAEAESIDALIAKNMELIGGGGSALDQIKQLLGTDTEGK